MFVEVVVDHPAARIVKPFHYSVPENLRSSVSVGSAVIVPFGPRRVTGYVVGTVDKPDVPNVKDVLGLAGDAQPLPPDMMELARWMGGRYLCRPSEAIAQMFPVAVRRKRASARTEARVELAVSSEEAEAVASRLEGRAPRQAEILRAAAREAAACVAADAKAASVRFGRAYAPAVRALARKGILRVTRVEVMRSPATGALGPPAADAPARLTPDQARALAAILEAFALARPKPILLHGVTASGKTEVYLRAIAHAIDRGKGAILLVPEIALTPRMVRDLHARFGRAVAVLHSRLSVGERYDEWRRVRSGDARVVIGARSAVFAPVPDLGLIVVDEEQEGSYKQEDAPRYHAREVALERARMIGCPCVLGSATPSVESFHRALGGEYEYVELPRRIDDRPLPTVEIVDMREELASGNRSVFSRALARALASRLERGEQTVLFINRRGHSTFVLCRECGHVMRCPQCDVALTYHAGDSALRCHYCEHEERAPDVCPRCESRYIRYFGAGTEKVESEVRRAFPQARVVRMDLDTTSRKGASERIVNEFAAGKHDILVGTQMVAKGHDFPGVTLVGVVSADTSLNLPDFKAGERTFQLLTQVAGRAGRGDTPGHVVVQTYAPDHYAVRYAVANDYRGFYEAEARARRDALYPPFAHLALVVASGEDPGLVERHARALGCALRRGIEGARAREGARVLGPAPCVVKRVRGMHRWQILVKGASVEDVCGLVREALEACGTPTRGVSIQTDIDPESII